MMKLIYIVLIGFIFMFNSGCASYMSYRASENEIYQNRIMASGDSEAIKQLQSGVPSRKAIQAIQEPGIFGIAIDLTAMDVIRQHPWRQLGAAALDAALVYGGYLLIQEIDNSDNSSHSSRTDSGRDSNAINITGHGNDVNIGNTTGLME